jgi:hypothetical protein
VGCPLASGWRPQSMEHARRRCGRSCLGPGFESPRLHEKAVIRDSAPFERVAPFASPIGEIDPSGPVAAWRSGSPRRRSKSPDWARLASACLHAIRRDTHQIPVGSGDGNARSYDSDSRAAVATWAPSRSAGCSPRRGDRRHGMNRMAARRPTVAPRGRVTIDRAE